MGRNIESIINTDLVYNSIYESEDTLYSFLLLTGYLMISKGQVMVDDYYTLEISNREVRLYIK